MPAFVGGGTQFLGVENFSTASTGTVTSLAATGIAGHDTLRVTGATAEDIGQIARSNGITLQELSAQQVSLEQRYLELTGDAVDYRTAAGATAPART